MSEQQYLAGEIALWLQQECGDPWTFLGCHNLTGISVPRGETNPVYCRVGKNKFQIDRTWRGVPGLGGLTIVAYDTVLNYIQEQPCAFNLVALHSASGSDDDPFNFDYLYYYNGVEVTSEETDTHVVGINPDEQTTVMLSMPATFKERVKVKDLSAVSKDLSSYTTNDINAVAVCDDPSCDAFGNLDTLGCQTIYMVTDGSTAEILKTADGGSTWEEIASPFTDTDQNIVDVACDGDTVVVVNGQNSSYAYSWDNGTTWTEVTTPTQVMTSVLLMGAKAWFVGYGGYVYYSSNRAATVSLQDAGVATTQKLNDIAAKDSLTLYAVGNNNAFIRTTDGGNIWTAVTGPSTGTVNDDLYKVLAIEGTDIVLIGDEEGNIYRSEDNGTTWTTVLASNTNLAGGITGLVACDCNVILAIGNDLDPYWYASNVDATAYQSVDGGNSWFTVTLPANDGINDLICCDVNRYWAVGEDGFATYISGAVLT